MERDGVYGHVNFIDCPLFFFPLEVDVLSFEQPNLFTTLFLDNDQTPIFNIASSLIQLQAVVGKIPVIRGHGTISKTAIKLMKTLMSEEEEESQPVVQRPREKDGNTQEKSVISNLVIIDRNIDYVSALLSQLNYEGLLDETFGINCSKVNFPSTVTKTINAKKHVVNSTDEVFRDIRDAHLSSAFAKLRDKGIELKRQSEKRNQMDLNQIKDFVKNQLKAIQSQQASLSLHVSACELIMEDKKESCFIER